MTEAVKEDIWLQGLLNDLGIEHDQLRINCDSMNASSSIIHVQSTSMSGFILLE